MTGGLPAWLGGWIALASLVTLGAYARDKHAAVHGRWRTPESTLQLLALAGGWPGALLGQGLLRHKTAKTRFQAVFLACVAGNGALLALLLRLAA